MLVGGVLALLAFLFLAAVNLTLWAGLHEAQPAWWTFSLEPRPDISAQTLLGTSFASYRPFVLTTVLPLLQLYALLGVYRCRAPYIPGIGANLLNYLAFPAQVLAVLAVVLRLIGQFFALFVGAAWLPGIMLDFCVVALLTSLKQRLIIEGAQFNLERHHSPRLVWGRIRGQRL